jgi:hypothetical protein
MSVGHIRLGNPGDLRPYLLHNYRDYQAVTANPFAARINTSEEWGSLEDVSEWTMDDWQGGQGQKDARSGGSLYARLDTMAPDQIMLSPVCTPYNAVGVSDGKTIDLSYHNCRANFFSISGTEQIASKITTGSAAFTAYIYIFARSASAFQIAVFNDNSNKPGASVALLDINAPVIDDRYFRWYRTTTTVTLNASSTYWLSVKPGTSTVYLLGGIGNTAMKHENAVWSAFDYSPRFAVSLSENSCGRHMVRLANKLYYSTNGTTVWKGASVPGLKTPVPTLPADTPTSLTLVGDRVYIGYGGGKNSYWITSGVITSSATSIDQMLVYNGYLWRSEYAKLYYTNNPSVAWYPTGGLDTGDTNYNIVSLAGVNGEVYAATNRGIFWAAPGDFVQQVLGFSNGNTHTRIMGFQGSLYIIAEKTVFLMDASGQVTDIWKLRHEDVDVDYWGTPVAMAHNRDILYVLSVGKPWTDAYEFTVWAFVQGGWHYVAAGFLGTNTGNLVYDETDHALYVLGDDSVIWKIQAPISATNAWYDALKTDWSYLTECTGWIEFPRFYGGPRPLLKEWHSVAIFGDNLNIAGNSVEVLWKNGTYSAWQSLGVIDSSTAKYGGTYGELEWDIDGVRPYSNHIQLALRITSVPATNPLRIEAIRLQYKTNVSDHWRWPLTIEVADNQQMLDGEKNAYTAAQMRAHLNSLINQGKSFVMEDIDGAQYVVTAEAARWSPVELEYYNGQKKIKWLLSLTLLQPTSGTYG